MQKVIIFISLLAAVVRFVDAQGVSTTYSCTTNFTLESSIYCYSLSTDTKDFAAAETECTSQGGYLVRFETSSEYSSFIAIHAGTEYWAGVKDLNANNTFYYADGTLMSSNGWGTGEPDTVADKYCGEILGSGYWATSLCNATFKYICEEAPTMTKGCTSGVINSNDTGIDACYHFNKTPLNFTDATAACVANGTTLFIATSQAEYDYAYPTMGTDMWYDATDVVTEGTFLPANALFTFPWNTNEPNDCGSNEDCTIIFTSGKANDVDCSKTYNYICKGVNSPAK